jgi:hypothetical protein
VPLSLTAVTASDGSKVLTTQIYAKLNNAATVTPVTAANSASVTALHTGPVGSAGIRFLQNGSTGELQTQLINAQLAYDARQIRALLSTDQLTPLGSQATAFAQNLFSGEGLVELTTSSVKYDARKTDPGIADTVAGGNSVASPGATVDIISVTPGVIGNYQIQIVAGVLGTVAAIDVGNLNLLKNLSTVTRLANPNNGMTSFGPFRLALIAADILRVRTINASTAGSQYAATISATRTG